MAIDFVYPSSIVLQQVAQELVPKLLTARKVFDIMPTREVDSHLLEWEQKDNYLGLTQVRGLNGQPSRVTQTGGKRYQMTPGVYGEFSLIDELQLTTRRQWGSFSNTIDVTDLTMEAQAKLLQRQYDRIEKMCWDLLVLGTFSVADGTSVLHTDSYTTQTFSASVPWATVATATPLADFRAIQLKGRGYSLNFGAAATAYMNRTTWNSLLSNTNAADLGGRRGPGLATLNGPDDINRLWAMDDLPNIQIYDDGYLADVTGTFTLFIPNNKVVVVGARRDGDALAEFRFTRNANNPSMAPGAYSRIIDDQDDIPRSIQVHQGFNGGPVIFHPAAVVIATV